VTNSGTRSSWLSTSRSPKQDELEGVESQLLRAPYETIAWQCMLSGLIADLARTRRMSEMQKPIPDSCFGGAVQCDAPQCRRCGFCLRHCRCATVVADPSGVGQKQDQAQQLKLCEAPGLAYADGFQPLRRKKKTGNAGDLQCPLSGLVAETCMEYIVYAKFGICSHDRIPADCLTGWAASSSVGARGG
jgi:hypothetical protein